jgi:two-component system sensor histidine kinase KdpD
MLGTLLWIAAAILLLAGGVLVARARAQARRQNEAYVELLRQSDELKTSLLRAVSHDLTTPLTAIRIHTAALQRHAASHPELLDAVSAIEAESTRLHRRIDNLLTIARLEAGRFKPHPEPTPPSDIFRAVHESLPLVPVAIAIDADCPDANVDPSLALEILVNLVENAHRASPPDAPIELVAERAGSRVRLEVRDRGRGITGDADVAQRGLGLEIARALTAASHGTFTLENRDGGGAVGRVELPAAVLA